ncbi:nucleoside recognition domain-containing protein [Clostridium sp. MCC353]|uniref:nucleoside recognition domain-containing protein n=1 Tax=Clostridium sp. MCC353 TaxID=2592646 RepID=UPI0031FF11DC
MLPPMAIFFPLFTLLEDLGYLPRVAFNMDHAFQKCKACGKQCLTMAMGLGCNAAGVVGCRIIDSPRERLIAILTNAMVPCNGRFPTIFTLITLFFVAGIHDSFAASLGSAAILTLAIVGGVMATLGCSWLLSHTLLKGVPSSFTLELPPYRRPQIGKVIVRSIFDRTLFVLGRAVAVAAPAGLVIWILANTYVDGQSLLIILTGFFDPLARLMGLDGVILAAFILGFPANEIVLPIILMAYLQTGTLVEMTDIAALKDLLVSHGWTWVTAVCMLIFCLFHWPCSTTCLTIRKETGSWKWTAAAVLLPTLLGFVLCVIVASVARLFN